MNNGTRYCTLTAWLLGTASPQRSEPLRDALIESRTQPYLVSMGKPQHAQEFRRKLRIDEQAWPLHVVGEVASLPVPGEAAVPVYTELG